MKYGTIPGVDPNKRISHVAQGLVMLSEKDEAGGFALLDAVSEAGITLFDSAHVYGGGGCDRVFGKWVGERGLREQVVLMDKCSHHNRDRRRVTPFDISADLHDCLARLEFDYIDIFSFHRDDEALPVGPLIERLNEHIDEGKIRAYGASNWTHERIREAIEYADAHGLVPMAVASPHYSLAECVKDPWGGGCVSITGEAGADAREWYKGTQMPVLPWSSLCGGFFSGRFTRDNLDRFTKGGDLRCVRSFCCEDNFRRLDRAGELAAEKGVSVAQIALAYCICGEMNVFPLMAAWTAEEAAQNGAACDIDLTPEEVAWLNLEADGR
jgi:aryl-alcohol dehydrogenase-like predicted oxidoreductase